MTNTSTKTRILNAAEELFALSGFDGTSIRAICSTANANVAAVHYHFKGKEGLAEALFERRMVTLSIRRQEMLDQLSSNDSTPSVHSFIEALVLPLAELMVGNRRR